MDKSLWGHALVAVAACTAALFAWQKPKAFSPDNEVVVIAGEPDRLDAVLWHEEDWDVSLEKQPEGTKVTVSQRQKGKNDAGEPSEKTVTKIYPGNKSAAELFKNLAPLKAPRSLGPAEGDKLTQLGLDKPSGTLTLAFGGEKKELRLGAATYGSGDSYAQLPDGSVYLLKATLLSPLKRGAATLLDKRALGLDTEEIARLHLSGTVGTRELVQRYADTKDKAFFADAGVPDEKLEGATAWVDRLSKLRVEDAGADAPAGAAALTVEARDSAGKTFGFELWRPDDTRALAKSSRYAGPLVVSKANAEALLRDFETLVKEGK